MSKKLYVGSLAYATSQQSLQDFFSHAGKVVSATVIMDKMTGRSKGFGFVEMESDEEAKNAVDTLNGKELDGRTIIVNEARPQEPRENRGGFGRGGGDRGMGGGNRRNSW